MDKEIGDVDYKKINNVGFTVYDEVQDIGKLLSKGNFSSPEIHMGYEWDNDPVLDIIATDEYNDDTYAIASYRHSNFNREEFDIFYNLWIMTIEEEIGNVNYEEFIP